MGVAWERGRSLYFLYHPSGSSKGPLRAGKGTLPSMNAGPFLCLPSEGTARSPSASPSGSLSARSGLRLRLSARPLRGLSARPLRGLSARTFLDRFDRDIAVGRRRSRTAPTTGQSVAPGRPLVWLKAAVRRRAESDRRERADKARSAGLTSGAVRRRSRSTAQRARRPKGGVRYPTSLAIVNSSSAWRRTAVARSSLAVATMARRSGAW